jgi:hypothetical protein
MCQSILHITCLSVCWRKRRQQVPLKGRYTSTRLHGIIFLCQSKNVCMLQNTKVYYLAHNSPPCILIFGQMNSNYAMQRYIFKIHFNIILLYMPRFVDPSGGTVKEEGLLSIASLDCGFKSRRRHGCLSFFFGVVCCQVEVFATGRSLVQRSPTDTSVLFYTI